jgi:uncharacterized membrane protein YbhN (UPF0104 family)
LLLGKTITRLMIKRLGLLLGLGILTVAVLLAAGDARATMAALAQADWRLVALAALIHYSGFAVRIHRWQWLLGLLGHPLGYRYVGRILLGGWFASAILPARAGDALRVGLLYAPPPGQPAVPAADAAGSLVSERVLDLVALLLLGAGFGWALLGTQAPPWLLSVYGVGMGLLVGLGLALLLAPALVERLRAWSNNRFWRATLDFAGRCIASLRRLASQPAPALLLLVESLYIWLCDAILLWLVLHSLGNPLPFVSAAFAALTADVVASLPLTPGALGQIETAYAAFLALLRLPVEGIPAAVLLMRGITYWSFLVISGVAAFQIGVDRLLSLPFLTARRAQTPVVPLAANAPADPPA